MPGGWISRSGAWTRAYGRLYVMQATLLRCDDESLAAAIKAAPKLKRFLLGEITPRDLLVDPARIPALLEALKAHGYSPRLDVISFGSEEDDLDEDELDGEWDQEWDWE